ncbi:hypothetical protein BDW74DRAFT_155878 [Aspergillus multicolor]|uniref:phosphotransferase family protein n=1 Tax=Aspergillus multicolor TaxID=41759 RepID=UPI003CCCA4ED
MADSCSNTNSLDEEDVAKFQRVRATLKLQHLPQFASRLRQKILSRADQDNGQAASATDCEVLPHPIFGSNHILFEIEFTDGASWLLKVPSNGYPDNFDETSARELRSEALMLRLVKHETTIPVPEVYDFSDSCDNELGCPFILMEYVDGRNVIDAWFDKSISLELQEQHREQILRDLAKALVQLNKFTFCQAGTPLFNPDGSLSGEVGPFTAVDDDAKWRSVSKRKSDEADKSNDDHVSSVLFEVAPFSDLRPALTYKLDQRAPSSSDAEEQGLYKMLNLFIDLAVQECQNQTQQSGGNSFVLARPHIGIQDVLVSEEDGSLLALLHWGSVLSEPQCMAGNESYPNWLTRDWDPVVYSYCEHPDHVEPNYKENSPSELAAYRGKWRELVSGLSDNPLATKLAHDSLVLHNLGIAAERCFFTRPIIARIFEETRKAAAAAKDTKSLEGAEKGEGASEDDGKEGDGSNKEHEDMGETEVKEEHDDEEHDNDKEVCLKCDFSNVCAKLAKGELEEEEHQRLVDGFRALFLHDG